MDTTPILYDILITIAPAVTARIERYRKGLTCSLRIVAAINVPKMTEVSRNAATSAIGACVMAHRANPYEPSVHAPPNQTLPPIEPQMFRCLPALFCEGRNQEWDGGQEKHPARVAEWVPG